MWSLQDMSGRRRLACDLGACSRPCRQAVCAGREWRGFVLGRVFVRAPY
jgi:hypothetical protein